MNRVFRSSHQRSVRVRGTAFVAVAAVAALLAGACSSSSSDNSSSPSASAATSGAASITATKDATIAAEVPSDIASQGTLVIPTDPTYAPNEFVNTSTQAIEGMDVDLGNALAAVMGLKAKFTNVTFDAIIPGVQAGKYPISMSSFTDTYDRQKVVDFVTYFQAGTSFYVAASGGPDISGLSDLCGHSVAVERGTTQESDVQKQAKKCKSAGQPEPDLQVFPDQNGANLALSSGRAEVVMADSPVAAYAVQQSNGKFKISGQAYGTAPYGIVIARPKGAKPGTAPMDKPILDALNKLMQDGTYLAILTKWGVEDGAIDNPTINGAIS